MFAVMSGMFGVGETATDHDYVTGTLLEKRDFFVLFYLFVLVRGFFYIKKMTGLALVT